MSEDKSKTVEISWVLVKWLRTSLYRSHEYLVLDKLNKEVDKNG